MSDYEEVWQEAYDDAIDSGLDETQAIEHANDEADNWHDRQMAKAEVAEDR